MIRWPRAPGAPIGGTAASIRPPRRLVYIFYGETSLENAPHRLARRHHRRGGGAAQTRSYTTRRMTSITLLCCTLYTEGGLHAARPATRRACLSPQCCTRTCEVRAPRAPRAHGARRGRSRRSLGPRRRRHRRHRRLARLVLFHCRHREGFKAPSAGRDWARRGIDPRNAVAAAKSEVASRAARSGNGTGDPRRKTCYYCAPAQR